MSVTINGIKNVADSPHIRFETRTDPELSITPQTQNCSEVCGDTVMIEYKRRVILTKLMDTPEKVKSLKWR